MQLDGYRYKATINNKKILTNKHPVASKHRIPKIHDSSQVALCSLLHNNTRSMAQPHHPTPPHHTALSLPKPLRKPLQHRLGLCRRPRRQRLPTLLQIPIRIPISISTHDPTLLHSHLPHLHRLSPTTALTRTRLGRAPRRREILRRRITPVVQGRRGGSLGPGAIWSLLERLVQVQVLVLIVVLVWVLGVVVVELVLGGLAVAFAVLVGDEELLLS